MLAKDTKDKLKGVGSLKTSVKRIEDELLELGQRGDLEPHQIEQLERFATWLDHQPPV